MPDAAKKQRVVIAGAGTFGISTAWRLARSGYTDIVVLDSAGHDLNKIFRTEYADPLYAKLAHEARDAWHSEEALQGLLHECGYIFAVTGQSQRSVENWQQAVDNSRKNGVAFEDLSSPEQFRAKCKVLNGPMRGWRGVYNAKAGWTHARNALTAGVEQCKRLGVEFRHGPRGEVRRVEVDQSGRCTGVRVADGSLVSGDIVILALGAWLDSVIETHNQSLAKAWCFAHIDLSSAEAAAWKDAPVINNRELGYIFEPDLEGRKLKIAAHGVGYSHYIAPGKSYPRCKMQYSGDGVPDEVREQIRELLRQCLPDLADRPFAYERMCWDADTPDAHFLITRHPEHPGLVIAGGGAAHGFKFFPIIGKCVEQCIDGTLAPELAQVWQWRPNKPIVKDYARPDKPDVDLADVKGWQEERMSRL